MATNHTPEQLDPSDAARLWMRFAIRGYAAICASKHGLAVPLEDINTLSDEELKSRLTLVRDLAHLPPG
jgi:imidazolonepropionase-like amidohydrolase